MQTFLPYPSFARSARSLDNQRLGKQRVETLQILNVLTGQRILNPQGPPSSWILDPSAKGWGNHPMTRMWEGHELSLLKYGLIVCRVWTDRGYRDTCFPKMRFLFPDVPMSDINDAEPPPWLGDEAFHLSHQSNLVRKAKVYYRHHSDLPHEPHPRCDGQPPHKPHGNCRPKLMWRHYRPQFPDVPLDLPYVWPV